MANLNGESEYKTHIKPGLCVWIRIVDPDKPGGKLVILGEEGELTYSGYQHIGTATFMIFDQVVGSGKKTKINTLMINATDVKHVGVILFDED